MKIKNSLEWSSVETELIRKSHNLSQFKDIRKMISNLHLEVAELSRAEVAARRGKNYAADSLLHKINEDIETVEEFILVAALLG